MIPFWSWLDRHPETYWVPAVLSAVLLIWHAWRAPATPQTGSWTGRWRIPLLIFLTLLVWRWPQLITHSELNPDESQFIAGALTLRHDPVFWRSVDGFTSGPLISFALVPVALLGLPVDFLAARLVALLAIVVTFTACYRLLLARYSPRVASFAVTPAAVFFALTTDPDFNHYSSEMVPLGLIAMAAWLLWRPGQPGGRTLLIGGFVAGLTPWAKLQAAPIAAVVVVIAFVRLAREARPLRERGLRVSLLAAATLLPAALVLLMAWHTGTLGDFHRSYLIQNFIYAEPTSLRVLGRTSRYWRTDFAVAGYAVVLVGAVIVLVAAVWARRRAVLRPTLLPAATGLLLVSGMCVIFPGRDFLHYAWLLLPGLLLLSGAALGEMSQGSNSPLHRVGVAAGLATLLCLVALRSAAPMPPIWGRLAANARFPVSGLGALVSVVTKIEPTVTVWGWQHEVYVEAQARQGVRSAYTYWELVTHPQRDYFRQRYLADFAARRPAVFIDAVGESTFFFSNRETFGHETFPALAAIVGRDYCQVAELRYARVYLRRDLLKHRDLSQRELWRAFLTGPASDYMDAPEFQDLNRFNLPRTTVEGRFVLMMRPPANISWILSGSERDFRFLYGYLPEALSQAEGNGTELIVTLTTPDGQKRQLSRFLYNPAHDAGPTGPRPLRVLLPPGYPSGSTLRLKTTPGPGNNDAWDWLYVTRIGMLHYGGFLPRQFPAFNRPPDSVEGSFVSYTGTARDPQLELHAPATLRFTLRGHERLLDFTFGFRRGASTNGGNTNGATFRVRATRPDASTPITLFERVINPIRRPPDRGPQRATLELPELPAGTSLEIAIDPNGSNAWDWTFIDSLRLG